MKDEYIGQLTKVQKKPKNKIYSVQICVSEKTLMRQ